MAYGLCAIWSLNYLCHCARWTGDIYFPHIKLSDCPYVRISSIATQLMSSPLFRYNLHKLSFALRSVAEDMKHDHKKNISMWTEIAWGSYDPSHLCVYKQDNSGPRMYSKQEVTEVHDWCKTTIQIYGIKLLQLEIFAVSHLFLHLAKNLQCSNIRYFNMYTGSIQKVQK